VTDRDLNRELADLLNVSLSHDFGARVRMRIADQAPSSRWPPLTWRRSAIGGLAVAVVTIAMVAVGIVPRRSRHDDGMARPEPLASRALGSAAVPPIAPPPLALVQAAPAVRPAPSVLPRALVPAAERAAMARLIGAIEDGRAQAPAATSADNAIESAPVDSRPIDVEPIDVAQIEVPPIAFAFP
jgi:hypothetical protein